MAVSGEDRRMQGFFDGLLRSAADLEVSKAVKQQGQQIVSTVGSHVRDVLGEVQEVFDFIKSSFRNIIEFFKGIFADIGRILGGVFGTVDEKVFRTKSVKQGEELVSNTDRSNELFMSATEKQETFWEEQLRVQEQTRDAISNMDEAFERQFMQMLDEMDTANKIAGDQLDQTKKEELAKIRAPKDKKRGLFGKLFDLIFGVILAPFMLIAGVIAGFVGTFGKVLFAPLKLLKGVGRAFATGFRAVLGLEKGTGILARLAKLKIVKTILAPFKLIKGLFGFLMKNPILKAVFKLGKGFGSKVLFPLFVIFDALSGLTKFKKIFGEGAGFREAIESAVAGIVSGFIKLPAMALDWLIKKLTGIETDFASYFEIEKIAKFFHGMIDWIDDTFIAPIRNFFESDTWDFIKDETSKTIEVLKNMIDKLTGAITEAINYWKDKIEGLVNLLFKETEVEKRYREKELAGKAAIDIGMGEADIGLGYSKKEAEEIMALGATAEERRAALAEQTMKRREEAKQQHSELLQRLDKLISVSEIYEQPDVNVNAPTAVSGGARPTQSSEPKEQVAGIPSNSGLP